MTHSAGDPWIGRVWLSRREAAEYARVSQATIDRAIHSGALRSTKPNKRRLVHVKWIDAWLRSGVVLVLMLLVLALATLQLHSCAHHHGKAFRPKSTYAVHAPKPPPLRGVRRRRR